MHKPNSDKLEPKMRRSLPKPLYKQQKPHGLVRILLLLVLGLIPAGCGLVQPSEPTPTPVVVAQKAQIRWFVATSEEKQGVAKEFAAAFNDSQDEIELVVEAVHPSQRDQRLATMLETGDLPDIVGPTGFGPDAMQFFDLILDLTPIIANKVDDIDPHILEMWQVQGKIIGVPFGVIPSMLVFNVDLFDAASLPYPPHSYGEPYADGDPWTIEKMEQVALMLTLDRDGNNATRTTFDPEGIVQWGFHWQWVSGLGLVNMFGAGSAVDEDGTARIPDRWRDGFRWYYDGMWKDHFIPKGDYDRRPRFESGDIAMMQMEMWYLPTLQEQGPFNWNVAAIPSYKGETTVRWLAEAFIVLNTTEHPQQAVQVAYMLAAAPELATAWGSVPAFKSLQRDHYEQLEARYPDLNVEAIKGGMEHLSFPSHNSDMPNNASAREQFEAFRDKISTTPNLDLDPEIDDLESRLQTVFTSQ